MPIHIRNCAGHDACFERQRRGTSFPAATFSISNGVCSTLLLPAGMNYLYTDHYPSEECTV